jgi:hypothetical protein
MKYVVTISEDVARTSLSYLPILAAISFLMDVCNHAMFILSNVQDHISLMLCGLSFPGCGLAHENACLEHQGGYYVENEQ